MVCSVLILVILVHDIFSLVGEGERGVTSFGMALHRSVPVKSLGELK